MYEYLCSSDFLPVTQSRFARLLTMQRVLGCSRPNNNKKKYIVNIIIRIIIIERNNNGNNNNNNSHSNSNSNSRSNSKSDRGLAAATPEPPGGRALPRDGYRCLITVRTA